MKEDNNQAILEVNGQKISLPIKIGHGGEVSVDISNLYKETGIVTFDQGLGNTATCSSSISYIDGTKGILRYRGIDIEDLAKKL